MNQRGGMIEVFVGMILALMAVGFYLGHIEPVLNPLTASSTWSGSGTTAGLIMEIIGLILLIIIFFWSYKRDVNGAINF